MDWVHCNVCFSQPGKTSDSPAALHLTSCGHICCTGCLPTGIKDGKCKICNSDCNYIKLVLDMNHDVLEYFSEPIDLVKKFQKILDFQKQHRVRLTARRVALELKYSEAKLEIKRLTDMASKMYEDMIKVMKENKALKSVIASSSPNNRKHQGFTTPVVPQGVAFYSPNESTSRLLHRPSKPEMFHSTPITPLRSQRRLLNGSATKEYYMGSGINKGTTSLLTPSSTIGSGTPRFE